MPAHVWRSTRLRRAVPPEMISGVQIHPLRQIADERGKVMHMLRRDDAWFERFGEIYFSTVRPRAVKAWHFHRRMTLNYAVVSGRIKLVLYDDREGSPTRGELQELHAGESEYVLVTVPPRVWNGFQGIGAGAAIVANCATEPYDPEEIVRIEPVAERIPYEWEPSTGDR